LEKQPIEPAIDVPVDEAKIIANDVVAIVGELDRLTAPLAPALAFELAGEQLAAHDIELIEPGHEGRVEQEVGAGSFSDCHCCRVRVSRITGFQPVRATQYGLETRDTRQSLFPYGDFSAMPFFVDHLRHFLGLL